MGDDNTTVYKQKAQPRKAKASPAPTAAAATATPVIVFQPKLDLVAGSETGVKVDS